MAYRIYISTLLGIFTICDSFNLETRLPVIKRGNEGSYFGFSVAEHQSFDEVEEKIEGNWLLVGAPLDQNKQPKTNHSGALWRCPLTTYTRDCDQVTTDGKRRVDDDQLMPPLEDEIKNGQWLGVTVRSEGTGKKVLVCAHRYMRGGDDYAVGGGLCYTFTQRLDSSESLEPCLGKPYNKAHEQYGLCQAGTSGIMINDAAVIGTPGPYSWRGQVYVTNMTSDYLSRDKTHYYSPVDPAPVGKYSYLGMSVTAGEFLGNGLAFAAGAPRSNGTGEVFIFTRNRRANPAMNAVLKLIGEQFTSNFGYELGTADLNGDKIPDLLVGAPTYFTKDAGGAVYVYLNDKEHCLRCQPPVKLTGQPESKFGISITNLGDLNKDGFDDIAVGAPYEGMGAVYIYLGSKDGIIKEPSQVIHGELYNLPTFGYSLSGGLDLDNNGYPDLLIGAYESDAIVLLRSRPIVGLSTKIGPSASLSNIDPNSKGCNSHPHSNHTCFTFEACVSMKEIMQRMVMRSNGNIRLKYKLEADVHKKLSRVWFGPEHHNYPHKVEREIGLKLEPITGELKHCQYHTVFVKEGTKDIQSAISMRLTYWLVQAEPSKPKEGGPLPQVNDFPILNQQQAAKIFDATFLKDCGDNDLCESELYVEASLNLPFVGENAWELVLGENQEVILNATVYNLKESAYEAQLHIQHSPSLSYIGHRQKDKIHSCQPVNSSVVICNVGNPLERLQSANVLLRFSPSAITDIENKVEFVILPNTTSLLYEPVTAQTLRATVIKRARLSLKGLARPEQVFYGGDIKGESAMKYKDDIGTRVLHTYQVVNQGPWHVSTLELHIEWPFQVANNKPHGKWLLYMDEKPSVEALGGGECFMSPRQVNPLGLLDRPGFLDSPFDPKPIPGPVNSTSRQERVRRRRDIEVVVKSEPYIDRDGRRHDIVNMNCERGSAKCFKFKCVIYQLQKNQEATVFIKARLWNTTLVEDYPNVYLVKIASRASIHIPPSIVIHQDTSDDVAEVETVARVESFKPQTVEDVPLWIILLACVSGILILLLFIVVLWKLGFFKRRRPDPTLSGNLEKHRVDDYHDY